MQGALYRAIIAMLSVSIVLWLIPYIAALTVPAPPFSSVALNCKGIGDALSWLVESHALNETIIQEKAIISVSNTSNNSGTLFSTLTIETIPANDGLEIGCIVAFMNPFSLTLYQNYFLHIRGISSVEDLNLNFTSNTSLLISWLPPAYHSSDVTIEFYTYEVVVTYAETFSSVDAAVNTTTLELANITMCDTFNVSVTAFLAHYMSNSSIKQHNGDSPSLNFTTKGCEIFFKLISLPTCQFILRVSHNNSILMQKLIAVYTQIPYILLPHKSYQLFVQVENLRKGVQNELQTNISTYFVQDFNITKNWDNGSLTIKFYFLNEPNCHFINATGISVVFKTPIQLKKSFNITSDNDAQLVTLSKSGNYSVSVYDIVNGSLLGPVFEFYGIQVDLDISTTEHISSTYSTSVTPTTTFITIVPSTNSTSVTPTTTFITIVPSTSSPPRFTTILIVCFIIIIILLLLVLILSGVTIFFMRKKRHDNKKKEFNITNNFDTMSTEI